MARRHGLSGLARSAFTLALGAGLGIGTVALNRTSASAKDEPQDGGGTSLFAGAEFQARLQQQQTAMAKFSCSPAVLAGLAAMQKAPAAEQARKSRWVADLLANKEKEALAGIDPAFATTVSIRAADGTLLAKSSSPGGTGAPPNPSMPPCWRVSIGHWEHPNGPTYPAVWVETGHSYTSGCPNRDTPKLMTQVNPYEG